MKRKSVSMLIIIAVLIAVLVGAGPLYKNLQQEGQLPQEQAVAENSQPAEESAPQPVEAPDFTMADAEGNSLALSDYRGQPVVLSFWASWCGICTREMPLLNEMAAEMEGQVQFMMVNLTDGSRETLDKASAFISDQGYDFPVYYDTQLAGAKAYAVRSIPVTFFIDAEGYVQGYYPGPISEELLRTGLDLIIQ